MNIEALYEKYLKISKLQTYHYKRYFYHKIDFSEKMVGIIGARGTGKTTSILQYLNSLNMPLEK